MSGLRIICAIAFSGLFPLVAAPLNYARDIRPILSDACYNCHGPDKKARKAKLRLDNRLAAMESGVFSDGEELGRDGRGPS